MFYEPDAFISIPLPTALVKALLERSPKGVSSLIETVVYDFLDRTGVEASAPAKPEGLYWESLFLPNGTEVRTRYFGEYKTAQVIGENIVWEGKIYPSFARLTNALRGGTINNAWKELQIKRPSDKAWVNALLLRRPL
ncbi:MAG: hypothetical protein EAZ11_10005 [Curvibacter sp.]|nr:MAG: hypothetical protein EAZ11_10005 [Curvibacter sp.]